MRIPGITQFAQDIAIGALKHIGAEVQKRNGCLVTVGSLTNKTINDARTLMGVRGVPPSALHSQITKQARPGDVLVVAFQLDEAHACLHVEIDGGPCVLLTADVVRGKLGDDISVSDTTRLLPVRKPS